jgi:Probable Zinc-ribbon domain
MLPRTDGLSATCPLKTEVLARLVGRELNQVAKELERTGVRHPARRSMRELAAIVLHDALLRTRAEVRRARLAARTSRKWVAGYPRLLAELHPTNDGDLFPDEVSYGSGKRIWWTCPRHCSQSRVSPTRLSLLR